VYNLTVKYSLTNGLAYLLGSYMAAYRIEPYLNQKFLLVSVANIVYTIIIIIIIIIIVVVVVVVVVVVF
jgi:hypothetical protein